jgi:uncharacterized protein YkwD
MNRHAGLALFQFYRECSLSVRMLSQNGIEAAVHRRVNAERITRGYDRLTFCDALQEVARYHSRDMAARNYLGHVSPDGETVQERYGQFDIDCRIPLGGGRYITSGENIYEIKTTADDLECKEAATRVVEGWLESPGHCENLLKEYWRLEGSGATITHEGRKTVIHVTQNFG